MSEHTVEVVQVGEILSHPNADRLAITHVRGWQVVIGKDDFKPGDKAFYVEPDYVVPTDRPEFAFLSRKETADRKFRVKPCRFRGERSQGLLLPLPSSLTSSKVGDNVAELLGVERYVSRIEIDTGGDSTVGPPGLFVPKFDVESLRRYPDLITPGTPVIITEKIHGCNARFVCHDGQMYCGSRTQWKTHTESSLWWRSLAQNPVIEEWCRQHPDTVLFGEVFGQVQDLKYGAGKNDLFVAFFAALTKDQWLPWVEWTLGQPSLPLPPILYTGTFDFDVAVALADGPSLVLGANHCREGCVIATSEERLGPSCGRLVLKVVSDAYLERA